MKSKVKITSAIIAIILAMAISPIYAQWGFKVGEENKMPSADTWNFIKYGEVGASLHSGTVNISIPIYTYQDNDFTIPIALNYASNGYVANVRPGILGPDWVLDAGGKISVEIKGMHDLKATGYAKSYYQFHQLTDPGTGGSYWRYSNFADQNVELGAPAPEIIYVPDDVVNINQNTPKYDAEPDFFHFNFMGYSGSFHLGPNNTIYVYNTNGNNKLHKIELIKNESNNVDIIITDKNGYKYEFPYLWGDRGQDKSGDTKLRVTYNLSKITAPNGRTVEFDYEMYDMTTYRPATFAKTGGAVLDLGDDHNPVTNQDIYSDQRILESVLEAQILSGISVDNDPIINFVYKDYPTGAREQYRRSGSSAMEEFTETKRLSAIKVYNPHIAGNPVIRQADLTYINADYNINYLVGLNISGEGTYSFDYCNISNGSLPPIGTFAVDHWGYYNGKSVSHFLQILSSTNQNTLDETHPENSVRRADSGYAQNGMLQRITYPTGGYSCMEYEAHSYSKSFVRNSSNSFIPQLVNQSGTCGGLRIKSVSNHLADGTQMNKKTYSYTNTDGSSSGILLYFPKYWITYSAQAGSYIESNIQYWSNNLISHNGSHIEYSTVTQTNSDGSCEVFHFSNSSISSKYRDFLDVFDPISEIAPGNGVWSITSNPIIRNIVTPLVSMKAERGKLLKHEIYAAGESSPVKEITYTYDTTRVLPFSLYPVYVIRKFGEILVHTDNWRLISKTEKENNGTTSVTRTETYTYNALGQLGSTTVTASNGTQEITRYTYPYDHSSEGGIFTTMLDKNLHGYPVSETRYIKENGVETLIGGKKYSYSMANGLVKPSILYNYNTETTNWETEHRYTAYDSLGNLLESYNAVNVPTSYIWGYGGMYLVGKVENATRSSLPSAVTATPLNGEMPQQTAATLRNTNNLLLTTFQYNPLIGLSKITFPNGTTESYTYNSSGKLSGIYDHMGEKKSSSFYSPDNRQ